MPRSILLMIIFMIQMSCVYHDAVTNANCEASDLGLTIVSITDVSTCGATDGSASVSATGGVAGYTFNIDGGIYQNADSFTGLAAGTHTISVKDANGCVATQLTSINTLQSTLEINTTVTGNSGCPTTNGSITITATGGTPPYEYKLNSSAFQSSNIFTSLAHGDYAITVSDASNCPASANVNVPRTGPSFAADIKPILTTKCAINGCHNGSQAPNLSSYANIKGNATLIKSRVTSKLMPPSNSPAGSLSQDQINQITCWVNDGTPNN
jgi:hypothetical protein